MIHVSILRRAALALGLAAALAIPALAAAPASAFPAAAGPALSGIEDQGLATQAKHSYRRYYPRYYGRPYYNRWRYYGTPYYRPYYNGWRYDRFYHGPRYGYRYPGFNYFYGGYWYANPWWMYDDYQPYRRTVKRNSDHVAWCRGRYKSYNRRTDTFMGYDGRRRRCNSPYD